MFAASAVPTRRGRIRVAAKRNHNKEERGRYLRVPDVNCLHERWGQLFRLATWQTLH